MTYYLTNLSIINAIKTLHKSGTHDYFRTYLALKVHGMVFGSSEYIKVTTTNTKPAFQTLFFVPGLDEDRPYYNPFRNELLKHDTPRGTLQTHVKKFLDTATKTKMIWLEGEQRRREAQENPWYVRFSSSYPSGLGAGLDGLSDRENVQITIHRPSFLIWMCRNDEWAEKPDFEKLWLVVKNRTNLHSVEIDLLFTDDTEFSEDPFTDIEPDRSELVQFISEETALGSTTQVLLPPTRPAFPEIKIQRIISSYKQIQMMANWWQVTDIEKEALAILQQTKALLLVGAPGTGKTRLANQLAENIVEEDDGRIHRFQFHAAYGYEDFIDSLQPKSENGGLRFEAVSKRFLQACQAAQKEPQVVIIDEMNRADVSKVFGEAFMLIEDSYRHPKYSIPRIYKPDENFWIPPDLYLVATLNNIDKSTYDLDYAFRRRFGQIEMLPDSSNLEIILRENGCTDIDFVRILLSAFNEIQVHYPLGHAYFKSVSDRDSLKAAYRRVIRPTIEAYLGQYRQDTLGKIDSIFLQAYEVSSWDEYLNSQ